MEIPKTYNPHDIEPKWNRFWLEGKFSTPAEKDSGKPKFVIVIPPPNVTDVLHLGHALNNLIQDVLIRRKRMQGYDTLWIPGTDHAGIATQNMVERQLLAQGKTREDVGREKFVELLWQWKEEKGGRIIEQLKEIGCSCDWTRTRFTLDPIFSRAVREVFVRLYEEGLIYKGKYIINWCPRCGTALADDEVEHEEHEGKLWYIKYPFVDDPQNGIVVATTRPETMLGDTAVAVNPDDQRYKEVVGRKVILPLVPKERKGLTFGWEETIVSNEIPIVANPQVDPEFGTGAVKITPAHDPNDYWIGREAGMPLVLVMDEKAIMNENAGRFAGMDRYEAREAIVKELEKQGLLVRIEDHKHSVGHCYRCHTVIEPYLSNQWFVRMKPLAQPAIEIVRRGKIKFLPRRWEGVYFNWLNEIRDWCISRQLWWGHQIPVWYGPDGKEFVARSEEEALEKAREYYKREDIKLVRDEDVLDTWFSSWLWPFATMGWPDVTDDLKRYYPTDVLVTASEIIFFWVARMIMAGEHFCGERPFHTVYIHGTVRDKLGRKMSKSLGNGIDPLDVVKLYGRDALRFTLLSQAAAGQDLFIDMKSFEIGRNFTNKVWNASRLILMSMGDERFKVEELKAPRPKTLADRWILSRLATAVREVNEAYEQFRLDEVVSTIHRFFWRELCDWFLEAAKLRIKEDRDEKILTLTVFETVLRLMHPILPYLTEELWHRLGDNVVEGLIPDDKPTIMLADYPDFKQFEKFVDSKAEVDFEKLKELIIAARNIKANMGIGTKKVGEILLIPKGDDERRIFEGQQELIVFLARVNGAKMISDKPDAKCGIAATELGEMFIPLEGIVDVEKEVARIEKEITQLEKIIEASEKKLANKDFIKKAPKDVVDAERKKKEQLEEKLKILRAQLESIK